MWKMNCAQVERFDEALSSKEAEIDALKERISRLEDPGLIVPPSPTAVVGGSVVALTHRRRGKAPPISELSNTSTSWLICCHH